MPKTILLTGATGFLGSYLLDALIRNGYKPIILMRTTSETWRINHLLNQVISYEIDKTPLEKIFKDQEIDTVVHLATLYRKFNNGKEVPEMINSNVNFPSQILEIGIKHGLETFINTGTFFECDCSVLPVREQALTKAFNFYAKTKIAFEALLKTYREQLKITTLRLFSPYGPKDNEKLIPMLIKKALNREKISLSEGFQKLDFIYAEDIASAFLLAISNADEQDTGYKLYNIGSGVGISVREIVSVIEEQLEKPINKVWGSPSKSDIPVVFADICQAKSSLNWAPKYTIHQGIRKTIEYYKQDDKNEN